MAEDVVQQLRAGTAEQHAQLERAVNIPSRLATAESYAELLERFLGWYEPMENRLAQVPGWAEYGVDPSARKKAPWLMSDLQALGYTREAVAALPRCEALPQIERLAQGFGCAYVIEGSTLGGRHIAAMLKDSPIPESARSFFQSYGPEVGTRWKEFLEGLTRFAADHGKSEPIVAAARSAFASMQEWICQMGAVRG